MLRFIIREFRQLHYALKRYYRRRGLRPFTPEQEVERLLRRGRRLTWRR